jgi:hypothetical protein
MPEEIDVRRTTETGPTPVLRPHQELAYLAPHAAPAQPPLIPGALAAIFAALATVGAFAAGVLPSPASWIVAALAAVLALAAGTMGFEAPDFTVGRPLVKASLIGPLSVAAFHIAEFAWALPDGYLKGGLGVVVILCAGLAGIPLPRPTR